MRNWGCKTLLLAGVLMVHLPATARADEVIPLYPNQCAYREGYPTACASLRLVAFEGDQLTLIVSNTTTGHDEAWISELLFKFNRPVALLNNDAVVTYGTFSGGIFTEFDRDDDTLWPSELQGGDPDILFQPWELDDSPEGNTSGLGDGDHDWHLNITPIVSGKKSERSAQVIHGISVKIVIRLENPLSDLTLASCVGLEVGDCQQWTAKIQSIGSYEGEEDDPEGSGWTTVPEPATLILLASGLAALAGVGSFRRREKLIDE